MSIFYLVLALLFSLLIAVVAMVNSEVVAVNYLFGQARVSLIVLIIGSACAGALTLSFFSLFRGIRNHLKFREERHNHEQLQHRVEFLEKENSRLEEKMSGQQLEREATAVKGDTSKNVLPSGDDPEPSLG